MYSKADLAALLPYPAQTAHKYSRGKMVIAAGSRAYPGAACLCAVASQKVGAGYTEVFTDVHNKVLLLSSRPSLVVRSFEQFNPEEAFAPHYPGACVVGPGFDVNDPLVESVCQKALAACEKPLLIDGGALSLIASDQARDQFQKRHDQGCVSVLTPHDGEAARLLAFLDVSSNDRMGYAQELARAFGALVVLKGHTTIVSDGVRSTELAPGSAALAKAGTGDVLAGMIGGLLAQALDPFNACVLGVSLHGLAGSVAAEQSSIISVCAEDVLEAIPFAIEQIHAELTEKKEG